MTVFREKFAIVVHEGSKEFKVIGMPYWSYYLKDFIDYDFSIKMTLHRDGGYTIEQIEDIYAENSKAIFMRVNEDINENNTLVSFGRPSKNTNAV